MSHRRSTVVAALVAALLAASPATAHQPLAQSADDRNGLHAEQLASFDDRAMRLIHGDDTRLYGLVDDVTSSFIALDADGTVLAEAPVPNGFGGTFVVDGRLYAWVCMREAQIVAIDLDSLTASGDPIEVPSDSCGALVPTNPGDAAVWVPAAPAIVAVDLDSGETTTHDLSAVLPDNYGIGWAQQVGDGVLVQLTPGWDPVTGATFAGPDGNPLPGMVLRFDPAGGTGLIVAARGLLELGGTVFARDVQGTPVTVDPTTLELTPSGWIPSRTMVTAGGAGWSHRSLPDRSATEIVVHDPTHGFAVHTIPLDSGLEMPGPSLAVVGDKVVFAVSTDDWGPEGNRGSTVLFVVSGDATDLVTGAEPPAPTVDTVASPPAAAAIGGSSASGESDLQFGVTRVADIADRDIDVFYSDGRLLYGVARLADSFDSSLVVVDLDGTVVNERVAESFTIFDTVTIDDVPWVYHSLSECRLSQLDLATLEFTADVTISGAGFCGGGLRTDPLVPTTLWALDFDSTAIAIDVADGSASVHTLDDVASSAYRVDHLVPLGGVVFGTLSADRNDAGEPLTAEDGSELPPLLFRYDPATRSGTTAPAPLWFEVIDGELIADTVDGPMSVDPVSLEMSPYPGQPSWSTGASEAAEIGGITWFAYLDGESLVVTARDPVSLAQLGTTRVETELTIDAWVTPRVFDIGGTPVIVLAATAWEPDGATSFTQMYIVATS